MGVGGEISLLCAFANKMSLSYIATACSLTRGRQAAVTQSAFTQGTVRYVQSKRSPDTMHFCNHYSVHSQHQLQHVTCDAGHGLSVAKVKDDQSMESYLAAPFCRQVTRQLSVYQPEDIQGGQRSILRPGCRQTPSQWCQCQEKSRQFGEGPPWSPSVPAMYLNTHHDNHLNRTIFWL